MQQWQDRRITTPLAGSQQDGELALSTWEQGATPDQGSLDTTNRADAPVAGIHTARPVLPTPDTTRAPQTDQLAPADEDPELTRIREILVGPHLRDHQRRLSALERQAAEGQIQGTGMPVEWRAQFEATLAQERRTREEQVQSQARTLEQLDAALERERDERLALQVQLEDTQRRQQALQVELERERDAHVRLHTLHAAELDARLGREPEIRAEELRRLESARAAPVEVLQTLVEDAERALVAMQEERQYLAGLLAELGLHLIRHAASPAAAAVEQANKNLLQASAASKPASGV